jgi:hypothetical protein
VARSVVIHANAQVPWQEKRGNYFAEGFKKVGICCRFTKSRIREGGELPVLLGTTFWRGVEDDGGEYLLVDRCSFGDTETFVSLVWNGHGRRGDHKIPENVNGDRWGKYGTPMRPWQKNGKRRVLCGQTESYGPVSLEEWYRRTVPFATHFRTHPAGHNPTSLPPAFDFRGAGLAITLNSSVGVQAVLDGIPTVAMDEGSMAWEMSSHDCNEPQVTHARTPWVHRLAWTQWTDDEIREGIPWHHTLLST